MESNNPYESPKSNVSKWPEVDYNVHDLSDVDIKKLNKFSSDLNILGTISVICVPGCAYFIYENINSGYENLTWATIGMVVALVTVYSAFMRPNWGRSICMIVSLLILPGFPIGSFIGYIGLRASLDGKQLFGDERITNHELGEAIAKIEQQSV